MSNSASRGVCLLAIVGLVSVAIAIWMTRVDKRTVQLHDFGDMLVREPKSATVVIRSGDAYSWAFLHTHVECGARAGGALSVKPLRQFLAPHEDLALELTVIADAAGLRTDKVTVTLVRTDDNSVERDLYFETRLRCFPQPTIQPSIISVTVPAQSEEFITTRHRLTLTLPVDVDEDSIDMVIPAGRGTMEKPAFLPTHSVRAIDLAVHAERQALPVDHTVLVQFVRHGVPGSVDCVFKLRPERRRAFAPNSLILRDTTPVPVFSIDSASSTNVEAVLSTPEIAATWDRESGQIVLEPTPGLVHVGLTRVPVVYLDGYRAHINVYLMPRVDGPGAAASKR